TIVGAHSLVLRNKQQAFPYFGDQAYFEKIDPVTIMSKEAWRANGITIWVDIGRSDMWFSQTAAFHTQLQNEGIVHTWNSWDGGHDGTYCASHITDYLLFYGRAFAEHEADPMTD